MRKEQRAAAAFLKAADMARSGQYPGWRAIETAMRASNPDIRSALAATQDKNLIDDMCRQHYREGSDA